MDIYPTVSESVFDFGEFFFIMEIYKQAKWFIIVFNRAACVRN